MKFKEEECKLIIYNVYNSNVFINYFVFDAFNAKAISYYALQE